MHIFALSKRNTGVCMYKGHVAPSSSDSGSSGNIILDFYWVSFHIPLIFMTWHDNFNFSLVKEKKKPSYFKDDEIQRRPRIKTDSTNMG